MDFWLGIHQTLEIQRKLNSGLKIKYIEKSFKMPTDNPYDSLSQSDISSREEIKDIIRREIQDLPKEQAIAALERLIEALKKELKDDGL